MNSLFTIAQRDFKSFFETSLGWIAACIIFIVSGVVFYIIVQMLLIRGQSIDPVGDIFGQILGFFNYINIFIVPAFTMKVMSEELNSGTYRLQISAPISTWNIVFGKFLGVMIYFSFLGLLMFIYPLFSIIFTQPDLSVILSGWFGLILNTACYISIGLFIGSLTKNPVISYLGSAFLIIILIFSSFFPSVPEWYKHSANLLDLSNNFTKGIIKTSSIATYIAIILSFLTLCQFTIDVRKWRV